MCLRLLVDDARCFLTHIVKHAHIGEVVFALCNDLAL